MKVSIFLECEEVGKPSFREHKLIVPILYETLP
jgi:hypothetical protein